MQKNFKKVIVLLALTEFLVAVGCTHGPTTASSDETSRATAIAGGSQYAVLEFPKGSNELSKSARETLNSLAVVGATDGRKIQEIKVLAWADREYPAESRKATKQEVRLADQRADAIKKYLKEDLQAGYDVDNHNMAKRPNSLSEMFGTEDFKLKNAFEVTGAAPHKDAKLSDSKASKAVVFVKYE